ncbi:MAG: hypothetical protein VX139_04650 [Pseudomonadota bacterium]|jgi:hypothetical protein|nr:hypothetical protein [Pseudomonadota bacterium]MEC8000537.1 hypothetical protein [Pseudomonadota bacterium]|tara:strand:+ start:934 stop:1131 length:198 start_codon:yes stop_codon:yes gene_type:complete
MNNTEAFEKLNQKINSLIQKYSDQKGIIDLYIKKEREWKSNKADNLRRIKDLENSLKKLKQDSHE